MLLGSESRVASLLKARSLAVMSQERSCHEAQRMRRAEEEQQAALGQRDFLEFSVGRREAGCTEHATLNQ